MAEDNAPLMSSTQQEPERTTGQRVGNFIGSTLFTAALGAIVGVIGGIGTQAVNNGIDAVNNANAPQTPPPTEALSAIVGPTVPVVAAEQAATQTAQNAAAMVAGGAGAVVSTASAATPTLIENIGTGIAKGAESITQGQFWDGSDKSAIPEIQTGAMIGGGAGAALGAIKSMIVGPHTQRIAEERAARAQAQGGPEVNG